MIVEISILLMAIFFLLNFDKFSSKINLYDYPDNKRKFKKKKVSLLGGSFFIIFFNYFILANFQELTDFENFPNLLLLESYREILLFQFVIISIFLIGLYDDKYGLSARDRAVLLIFFINFFVFFEADTQIREIRTILFDENIILGKSSIFFTTICIFVLIMALNMFDGFNGQSFLNFLIIFVFLGTRNLFNPIVYLIVFLLFIFAYLNFKNKVYLGDGGVYFLGFLASYFLIKTYNFENIIYVEEIIIILLIPIVDMVRLFFTRIYLGRNPFLPDTNHIHHIINKKYGNKVIFFISFLLIIPQVLLFFEINYYLVLFIQMTLYIFFMTKLNSVKKKLR